MDLEIRRKLIDAVDAITKTTGLCIDPVLIKSLKRLARGSDANIRIIFDLLKEKLKKNHAQVRLLAVQVVDELFMRSRLFRSLLVAVFETFLQLAIGYRSDLPLPPPHDRAAALRQTAIECVDRWREAYGFHYRAVALGHRYLKETLRFRFPEIRERRAAEAEQRRARDARVREHFAAKYEKLRESLPELRGEIASSLAQMEGCFQILEAAGTRDGDPGPEGQRLREEGGSGEALGWQNGPEQQEEEEGEEGGGGGLVRTAVESREGTDWLFEDEEDEEDRLGAGMEGEAFGSRQLRQAALAMEAEGERRREAEANAPVFATLRELLRLVAGRHVAATQEWLTTLARVDAPDGRLQEQLLKEVIDLRNRLLEAKSRCEALGLRFEEGRGGSGGDRTGAGSETGGDDDLDGVEWETGAAGQAVPSMAAARDQLERFLEGDAVEELEPVPLATLSATPDRNGRSSEGHRSSKGAEGRAGATAASGGKEMSRAKAALLQEAPVVAWGRDLDHWGQEHAVPVDTRGLTVDNHWGPVDSEAVLPAARVKELSLRASYYRPQRALPNRPCNAPLRSGGRCERRDFVKCPLHGPIVPRDDSGQPVLDGGDGAEAEKGGRAGRGEGGLEEKEGQGRGGPTSASSEQMAGSDSRSMIGSVMGQAGVVADEGSQPRRPTGPEAGEQENGGSSGEPYREAAKQALATVRKRRRAEEEAATARRRQSRNVREHNAAVLRQAAIAGTAQGLGEVVGEDLEAGGEREGGRRGAQGKGRGGGGLSALLKKTVTSRDRLTRRLLSARGKNAGSEQIDREEERNYRDAHVNGW